MNDLGSLSDDLVQSLSLDYEPVGVTLYREADSLPPDVAFAEKEFKSYCQALVLAGEGQVLLLKKDQMGCKLGTSVLGFEEDRKNTVWACSNPRRLLLKQSSSQPTWKKVKPQPR
jgi:uncharacterized protein (DUF169 family)